MKKNSFCMGEYAEYGFHQQRLIGYVFRLCDMEFYKSRLKSNKFQTFQLILPILNLAV